jgi:hypothetical protein
MNARKKERLITLSELDYTSGELTTIAGSTDYPIRVQLDKGKKDDAYFIIKEYSLTQKDDSVYHLPFIFNADGSPWYEANLFFYRQSIDAKDGYTITDDLRRKASQLLDFKLFCENKGMDYLDFSSARPAARPSYRYFNHLVHERDDVSPKSLNKRTKVLYDFYKFLSTLHGYDIDIIRVETTEEAFIQLTPEFGKTVEMRSQTVNASTQPTEVPQGYVRDGGEDLRPLSNEQREELIEILTTKFSVAERLMHSIALSTGARKQSIFTMRMKHVRFLTETKLDDHNNLVRTAPKSNDGTYQLKAGPGTGIDTKFDKPQTLHFTQDVIDKIATYANSKAAKDRRELFKVNHSDILSDDDMYLFISSRGNCHYIAKNDPRYRQLKTRPKGEYTDYLKNKLLKYTSPNFPKDFTFHWLRATYAFMYYQELAPLVSYEKEIEKGQMRPGDEIKKIQQRMHHRDRETTEHYLKLFLNIDDKMLAQDGYEDRLFRGIEV